MGGNYGKNLFDQLAEVMEKFDSLETEYKKAKKEIAVLSTGMESLRKENGKLREKLAESAEENKALRSEVSSLRQENQLLRDDNERMKRILGNDSSNSSVPPSAEAPWADGGEKTKAANTYNGRGRTKRKKGAQPGHEGKGLSKADVVRKIQEGRLSHRIEDIGDRSRPYTTRYRLDLDVTATATEIRIHAGEDGKFIVPDHLKADVSYGGHIKAVCAYLYSEGVVSIDRICDFVNSLSGDAFALSAGSAYAFCSSFSNACAQVMPAIEQGLLNAPEICTDATPVTTDGKISYIRNFSTEEWVLYLSSDRKNLKALGTFGVLTKYAGILNHDHETALYNFGTGHAECNVHLCRYLRKNTEETGNKWSHWMESFLNGMNAMRKKMADAGITSLTQERLAAYTLRYDAILEAGWEQHGNTKGRLAKKEEKKLLNRLKKYRDNHLLFLKDFRVHYSNNMSEKDLRICKNREKMAGGFRTPAGREMYCNIMSFIETVKRRGKNIFQSISLLMAGTQVL